MLEIKVSLADAEPSTSRFHVRVKDDDGSTTEHDVTLSRADHDRLGSGHPSPEAFVQACFDLLLERESKGSILRSFDISQIATYFSEFEQEIAHPHG
jgi:hypothetical protein